MARNSQTARLRETESETIKRFCLGMEFLVPPGKRYRVSAAVLVQPNRKTVRIAWLNCDRIGGLLNADIWMSSQLFAKHLDCRCSSRRSHLTRMERTGKP